jgi:hypothetical protein
MPLPKYPNTLKRKIFVNAAKGASLPVGSRDPSGTLADTLDTIEGNYKKIDNDVFDFVSFCNRQDVTIRDIDAASMALTKDQNYKRAVDMASAAKNFAQQQEGNLTSRTEKDKKKVFTVVKVAATTFHRDMGLAQSEAFDAFVEKKARVKRLAQIATASVGGAIITFKAFYRDLKQTPTLAQYQGQATTGFHQSIRAISAALAKIALDDDQLSGFSAKLTKFGADPYKPTADGQVLAKGKEVYAAVLGAESRLKVLGLLT